MSESEAQFRTLVEAAPVGIFIQASRRFAYLNPAALKLFGAERVDEMLGREVVSHFRVKDWPMIQSQMKTLNQENHPVPSTEERIVQTLGRELDVEVRAVRFHFQGVDGGLVFLSDISSRKAAERELEQTASRLRELTRRLIAVQESERRGLARELHDEVGQVLTATKVNLQTVMKDPSSMHERLEESVGLVDHTLQIVRGMALDMRPSLLDDLGLVPAMRWLVDRRAHRTGIEGRFVADPEEMTLDTDIETCCFRAAQESLTNIARHSRACRF